MTEGCRGEGGYLLNKDNYRYLQDYGLGPATPKPVLKSMELGPRDRLSQAFWQESKKGRTVETKWGDIVWLDMRHLEKLINERLPLVRDLDLVRRRRSGDRPRAGASGGALHDGRHPYRHQRATPIAGLYAAGECACVSINGANRLGSNSLGELLVFGARAGRFAVEHAKTVKAPADGVITSQAADAEAGSRRCSSAPAAPSGGDAAREMTTRSRKAAASTATRSRCRRPATSSPRSAVATPGGARGQELGVQHRPLSDPGAGGDDPVRRDGRAVGAGPPGIAARISASTSRSGTMSTG